MAEALETRVARAENQSLDPTNFQDFCNTHPVRRLVVENWKQSEQNTHVAEVRAVAVLANNVGNSLSGAARATLLDGVDAAGARDLVGGGLGAVLLGRDNDATAGRGSLHTDGLVVDEARVLQTREEAHR